MNQEEIISSRKAAINDVVALLGDKLDAAKVILKKDFEQEIDAVLSQDFREKYSVCIDWNLNEESILNLADLSARILIDNDKIYYVYRLADYYGKLGWLITFRDNPQFMHQSCCFYDELQSHLTVLIEDLQELAKDSEELF